MTEEELQELEALRQEKRTRQQLQLAEEALKSAGVSPAFAALLTGEAEEDTTRRVEEFCRAYSEALAEDVRRRLPQQPPVVTAPGAPRPRRGIHRMG